MIVLGLLVAEVRGPARYLVPILVLAYIAPFITVRQGLDRIRTRLNGGSAPPTGVGGAAEGEAPNVRDPGARSTWTFRAGPRPRPRAWTAAGSGRPARPTRNVTPPEAEAATVHELKPEMRVKIRRLSSDGRWSEFDRPPRGTITPTSVAVISGVPSSFGSKRRGPLAQR